MRVRKSDVNDAQWLQRLHACRLLRASFRPGRTIAELRAYLRAREKHSAYAAAHIQQMQKALTFMNIQLHHVIASITGVTGMNIVLRKEARHWTMGIRKAQETIKTILIERRCYKPCCAAAKRGELFKVWI